MKRRDLLKGAVVAPLARVFAVQTPAIRIAWLEEPSPIHPCFPGVNNASQNTANPWQSPLVREALVKTRAGALRYPGGSIANYWDMREMRLFKPGATIDLSKGVHTQNRYTMSWVAAVSPVRQVNSIEDERLAVRALEESESGPCDIVWVLNMVTPGADYYSTLWERSVDQRPGSDDWWMMLNDRFDRNMEMLRSAEAAGIPIRYIEFGNEYHFGAGMPGDDTAGSVVEPYCAGLAIPSPVMRGAFPTPGTDYAVAVNDWARRLKEIWPDVHLSAVASTETNGGRPREWNTTVLPLIDRELVPAITLHVYKIVTEGDVVSGAENLRKAIESFRQNWAERIEAAGVPADRDWWLTEYSSLECIGQAGCRMGDPHGWGRGLHAAAMIDEWLRSGCLRMTHYHQFRQGIMIDKGLEISATGRVLSLIALASKGETKSEVSGLLPLPGFSVSVIWNVPVPAAA